ncbi:uncharacterized protein [Nerophis lumbriciformis]|uniref:uncharacterized protein isoform X3 n=1 Tax=Nerophis lumbriciformis TaxID=546530 RepID=UPI002ADFEFBF|nr:uncharacterized protein LOC133606655 isoform X3 [Nerophis lumbriciformis]
MFRKEKRSAPTVPSLPPRLPTVPSLPPRLPTVPSLPPRPNEQDLDNPITHSSEVQDSGGTQQTPSTVGKSATEDLPDVGTNPTPNPGMLKGVMQKVNPFKTSSQVPETGGSESSGQHPGMFKGMIQKVNPFKSSTQAPKHEPQDAEPQEPRDEFNEKEKPGMMAGVLHKVNPFKSSTQTPKHEPQDAEPRDEFNEKEKPGMMASVFKVNPFKSSTQTPKHEPQDAEPRDEFNEKEVPKPGMMASVFKVNPFKSSTQTPKHEPQDAEPGDEFNEKEKPGMMAGVLHKVNPFKYSQPKDTQPLQRDVSSSEESLVDNNNLPEKPKSRGLKGFMHKVIPSRSSTPMSQEDTVDSDTSLKQDVQPLACSSESLNDGAVETHSVWYVDDPSNCELKTQPNEKRKTFRIKRIIPSGLFRAKDSNASADTQPLPQEVEVQTLEMVEMTALNDGSSLDPLEDEDGLLAWWRTVDGWTEWNEATQNNDAEEIVEQAADRVFMAARLFVRLFNHRGASLQQRILELVTLADAADNFHKKTVKASIGGGVASVAGSITTITGLILAPFTAGTSLIVTAVGIGVATAGGVASASANITDTVHSKTDRKKVEKMIQDYQEQINDIKECLEFLQEGMDTLEEWNFEQYAESISKKHLNQNVKHVMKEGGRAGKALVINTESLINTVQVLSVAGGAAKAAQAMSITTGVMSGLFLALDLFFLAKDSAELKKGAKTEFAAKIREVCKDLQDGLLELNRIKEELQKTMDGIEVEVEEEDEEILKSDLKKLIELED